MSQNIGLVGIGVMGSNLALNMSDNSINVKVYNKSEEKINTLINKDLNIDKTNPITLFKK